MERRKRVGESQGGGSAEGRGQRTRGEGDGEKRRGRGSRSGGEEVRKMWATWAGLRYKREQECISLYFYPCVSPLISQCVSPLSLALLHKHTHSLPCPRVCFFFFFPLSFSPGNRANSSISRSCQDLSTSALSSPQTQRWREENKAVCEKQEHQSPCIQWELHFTMMCVRVRVCGCSQISHQPYWPVFQQAGRMIIKQKTFADTFAFFALSCGGFSLPRACPHMHFIMYLTVFKAPFNLYRSPHPLSLLCLVNLNLTRMIHAMSFNEESFRFSLHPGCTCEPVSRAGVWIPTRGRSGEETSERGKQRWVGGRRDRQRRSRVRGRIQEVKGWRPR